MFIDSFCEFPFNRIRLNSEGWVAMCCFMRPDPIQNESDAYIGNLLQNSFDEIWFGNIAESIRKETISGKLHKKCQTPGCLYSRMNLPYPKKKVTYSEYPDFLEIDLPNTHCNIGGLTPDAVKSPACIMCERASPFFKPEKDHLFQVLENIKHIVPSLNHIHIQGIAEPFYENRHSGHLLFDVLDILEFEKYSNKITVSITTNGTLLKKKVREEYLSRIPHSITVFSIDAATPETFKKIRIFDCFDKVLENLYAFANERINNRQFLKINCNVNILNVKEIVGLVDIAHKANINCLEVHPTDGFNQKLFVNKENCGLFRKAQLDIIERCEKLGVKYDFPKPLDLGMTESLIQITL